MLSGCAKDSGKAQERPAAPPALLRLPDAHWRTLLGAATPARDPGDRRLSDDRPQEILTNTKSISYEVLFLAPTRSPRTPARSFHAKVHFESRDRRRDTIPHRESTARTLSQEINRFAATQETIKKSPNQNPPSLGSPIVPHSLRRRRKIYNSVRGSSPGSAQRAGRRIEWRLLLLPSELRMGFTAPSISRLPQRHRVSRLSPRSSPRHRQIRASLSVPPVANTKDRTD